MTCRVPGCKEAHKAHYCKWCKNQNSNHFARDCWHGPGGQSASTYSGGSPDKSPQRSTSRARERSRSGQPKGRVGCRVPGCTFPNCLKTGHHHCKNCGDKDSDHFSSACPKLQKPGGQYTTTSRLVHSSHLLSSLYNGSPHAVKTILANYATDYGRAKEPKDVTGLLSTLQSAMGGRGGSFHGMERVLTSTFINETLPVLCGILSKGDLSFPLQPPSSHSHSGTEAHMTARQCFALIGAGFLCLHQPGDGSLNFDRLFDNSTPSGKAKLQCFIHYLDTMARAIKEGNTAETERVVVFQALSSPEAGIHDWATSTAPLVDVRFVQGTQASIFDAPAIRGDFANAHIAGGTLGKGAVQEEILFSIEPECLLARHLFPRAMQPTEAFMIVGSKTFSKTSGYGRETLRFSGPAHDTAATRRVDGHPVLNKYIVAFDAVNFGKHGSDQQYDKTHVVRDLKKAHTAFHCNGLTIVGGLPFATGNWGCGVFGGDPQWKLLIQWCAASLAGRPLHYYPRDERSLMGAERFIHSLKAAGCDTVGGLVQLMCDRRTQRAIAGRNRMSAFEAIKAIVTDRSRPPPPPVPRSSLPASHMQHYSPSPPMQHYSPQLALPDRAAAPPTTGREESQGDTAALAASPMLSAVTADEKHAKDDNPREVGYAPLVDTTDNESSSMGASDSDDKMDVDASDATNAGATVEETTPLLSMQDTTSHTIHYVFEYVPRMYTFPSEVVLKGSFDGWLGHHPMSWSPKHRCFVYGMPLPPGRYMYKFIVDDRWVCSSTQPTGEDGAGNTNNVVTISLDRQCLTCGVVHGGRGC
ncbi:unnamed protein product [Vitrella brassicaformis CCMP3155]|uniref:poly(ADP-ribose) glycohydrolase n=1 Tax=Vitrella brassicaformis (strain CCMP3155) TaxID=1169540 RepID=A0A0G4GMC9_VITBC|nr:unnamed protein product [Vitrella brassicaformis CCMP3155]|eukprot:CEM31363.1 unnamed protein product [Vitrella brassicaformis CCMP3155]